MKYDLIVVVLHQRTKKLENKLITQESFLLYDCMMISNEFSKILSFQ